MAIIFALLGTQAAHALNIGEIEVVSREGEPLLAYVPVSPSSPDEKITAACVSLANIGIVPGQNGSELSAARLELEGNKNVDQRIKISTAAPISAHSLTLQLKAHCVPHGLTIREFNFELKPVANTLLPQAESFSGSTEKDSMDFYKNRI
ncbi:MAG: hypothetical protein IPP36_09010 [Nitrosomonadales bacterium]|nr:hypothetical protein [Nitrosomonadales bacterium]